MVVVMFSSWSRLRILTGKIHSEMKFQRFRKVWVWTFGLWVHQINSLFEVLKLKKRLLFFTGKTPLFLMGPFCTAGIHFFLFVLRLASDRAVLYVDVIFLILVLSTKKLYSSFLKTVWFFQKFFFKVRALKTFRFRVIVT